MFDVVVSEHTGLDRRSGPTLGLFEPVFGSVQPPFCHGMLLAGVAPPPQTHRIKTTLGCIEVSPCLLGSASTLRERIALRLGLVSDLLISVLGDVEGDLPASRSAGFSATRRSAVSRARQVVATKGSNQSGITHRGVNGVASREFVSALLLGKDTALGDGGDVGSVEGDNALEDITSFGDVVGLGDDADLVAVPAPSGSHVQAAARRRRGDEGHGGGDGVGLVAVLGGRVTEPDVFGDVVSGQSDVAVAALMGHGERSVGTDAGDGPRVPVADRFSGRGEKATVVASGGDEVTDVGDFAAGDRGHSDSASSPLASRAACTARLIVSTWSLLDTTSAIESPRS